MNPRFSEPGKLLQAFSMTLVALSVACAPLPAPDAPMGSLDVLGPVPAFEPNALPLDWVSMGKIAEGQLSVVVRDGVPAQKVINGKQSFIAVKPTRASLLASPYLSWAWNMEPQDKGPHPVRLVIGFYGGQQQSRSGEGIPAKDSSGLPPHDRAMVIVWGLSALQRGSIEIPVTTGNRQAAARYTVRGGDARTPVRGGLKPSICRTSTAGPGRAMTPGGPRSPLSELPPHRQESRPRPIYRGFACRVSGCNGRRRLP